MYMYKYLIRDYHNLANDACVMSMSAEMNKSDQTLSKFDPVSPATPELH